jgi:hypothetical protein
MEKKLYFVFDELYFVLCLINLFEKNCILYLIFDELYFVFDELMGKKLYGKK